MSSLKLIFSILLFGWLSIGTTILGQPVGTVKLVHFSGAYKIPGESIQCIYQDKIGIMWLGSESLGLTKYDGKTHTLFSHDPMDEKTISSGFPVQIVEDKNNHIWIGTINGLNKLDRFTEKITRYFFSERDSNTLANDKINDMVIDDSGFIWIATANGITILHPEKDEFYRLLHNSNYDRPSINNSINTLHFDANKNLWLGTNIHGLYLIRRKEYAPLLKQWKEFGLAGIKNTEIKTLNWKKRLLAVNIQNILSITSSSPDSIWLGSQAGLFVFNSKTQAIKKKNLNKKKHAHLNGTSYHTLLIDSNQNLWAGTSNNGLVVLNLNLNTYQYLNADLYPVNNLKSNAIREVKELNNGMIWIATKFGGLHYYDNRQTTFPLIAKATAETPGLNNIFAISVIEDLNHNIWIGTKTGGLNKYNRKTHSFKYFTADGKPGSIPSDRIEDFVLDKNGSVWIGTQAGLVQMDPNTLKFTRHTTKHVRHLFYSPSDYIWIGTTNGLFRYSCKEKKISPFRTKHAHFFNVENNLSITRIHEDSKGILWIATSNNGLFEYHANPDILINHLNKPDDPHSISGNLIREIFEDSKKRLWIGTKSNGLNLYDRKTKKFRRIKDSIELSSATIYNILEDNNGTLWMGTHNGIFTFNPQSGKHYHYSTTHGLQSLIIESNAFCKTHDGYFLMGGNQGINIFNPDKVSFQSEKAPLVITKINLLNRTIARDISEYKSITIEKKTNYLSFEFALLDYTNPDENKYAYMLSPFDKNWIESGNRNYATYTNLAPGNYTFSVKGSDSLGIWNNDSPLTVEIRIPAPLWKQWWFTPLLILALIASIFLINHIRLLAIKRREMILTLEVKQRTNDLMVAYKKLEESKSQIEDHNKELSLQKDYISKQNKELENHRNHLEMMVVDRTRDLEKAKLEAEESDRLKSAFLANMSHEIRTPLNAIVGFIDLLDANQIEENQKKYINEIIQLNSNSLLQLINDIVDISMIEANQMVIKKRELNFDKFLSEIKILYLSNKELNNGDVELILSSPVKNEDTVIFTAPERVNQIFINLINNAIKFTENGTITYGYTINSAENQLVCFVKDTGCGISKENQHLLFERFRKIDADQNKIYRGTGLGLSISKNLCELLGGKIWVESDRGKGAKFYFTLPYTDGLKH